MTDRRIVRLVSQRPGRFVLTRDRLDELVPIEPAAMADRQVIEREKDDIDYSKFMKVDFLSAWDAGSREEGFELLAEHKGVAMVRKIAEIWTLER